MLYAVSSDKALVIIWGSMNSKKNEKQSREQTKDKSAKDEPCDESGSNQILKPVRPKIGESTDNLKQRAEWYQKRTGKS